MENNKCKNILKELNSSTLLLSKFNYNKLSNLCNLDRVEYINYYNLIKITGKQISFNEYQKKIN